VARLDRLARTSPMKLFEIRCRLVREYNLVVVPILEFDLVLKGSLFEAESFFMKMAELAYLEREIIRRHVKETMLSEECLLFLSHFL
jgi:DNA invertase Pin-like site-specific DNA recombinase